jgi:hypothetical protein
VTVDFELRGDTHGDVAAWVGEHEPKAACSGESSVKTAETSAISEKITKTVRHAAVQISGRFRSDRAVSTFK